MLGKALRSQRIVKRVACGLDEKTAGTVARRMQRVAVELDRPAVNGRNQERNCPVSSRHGCAVVEEFAGNGPLDRFSEGDQMQFRTTTTAHAKSSQRDGGAH